MHVYMQHAASIKCRLHQVPQRSPEVVYGCLEVGCVPWLQHRLLEAADALPDGGAASLRRAAPEVQAALQVVVRCVGVSVRPSWLLHDALL
jgi:hypothetical protein